MDENLKVLLKDLWRDKPLLITVAVGLAVVLYVFYRNAHSATGAATTSSVAPVLTSAGATYVEGASAGSNNPVTVPLNIVAAPVAPVAVPVTPASNTPLATSHAPGTTFLGPTGVKHYVATGTQTLSQIAQKFGLQSWNSIYAIPDNMKIFGKLNASQARVYTPRSGLTITLPGSTTIGF